MTIHDQRVEAVKSFAQENKKDEHWAKVLELTDNDIYDIVKQTQSPQGAIRKIARMIGSDIGRDIELPAPTRTQTQAAAEEKLVHLVEGLTDASHPYDAPEFKAPPASVLRPEEARMAVRGTAHHVEPSEAGADTKGADSTKVRKAEAPKANA